MQTHLQSAHKEEYETVRTAQAVAADSANTAKVDSKNECVRGTVPLYSLKNKNERREFLKLVNILVYFLPWEALPICGLNSGNV